MDRFHCIVLNMHIKAGYQFIRPHRHLKPTILGGGGGGGKLVKYRGIFHEENTTVGIYT